MSEKLIKALKDEEGETHTVEIHPHIDHLYRVKDHVESTGKGNAHISSIKKMGLSPNILNTIPRDAKGRVTAEDIDKHIESLPKKKADITVLPYGNWGGQQVHRKNPEFAAAVSLHKDEIDKMPAKTKEHWDRIKSNQHSIGELGENSSDTRNYPNRVGWARIDPHHNKENTPTPHDHWHLDEIQSDFQNAKKIARASANTRGAALANHPEYDNVANQEAIKAENDPNHQLAQINERIDSKHNEIAALDDGSEGYDENYHTDNAANEKAEALHTHVIRTIAEDYPEYGHLTSEENQELHDHLSMGHDDPQHALHSAINQLGRKLGVKSTSMDMPKDQAKKSAIQTHANVPSFEHNPGTLSDHAINSGRFTSPEDKKQLWNSHGEDLMKEHRDDPDFNSGVAKLGGIDGLKKFAEIAHHQTHGGMFDGEHGDWKDSDADHVKGQHENFDKLSDDEKNSLSTFLLQHHNNVRGLVPNDESDAAYDEARQAHEDKYTSKKVALPVHQINTYNKRPKKLGFKPTDKRELLGDDPEDHNREVQFSKLHKNIADIRDLLRKIKD